MNLFVESKHITEEFDLRLIGNLDSLLKTLRRKPNLLLMGHYDSGKTRIVNHLLRTNKFPTRYTPTTKIPTIIYHISEKPAFMNEKENAWIFREGIDISRINQQEHCLEYCLYKDDLGLLSEHGVIQDAQLDDCFLAVAYFDSPLLKACNIIDSPGSGNEMFDDDQLKKLINNSSLLMDILIFTSRFQGFLDSDDIQILGMLLERLPKINSEGKNNLENLFLVASHAGPNIKESDITVLKDNSAKRLNRVFGNNLFNDLGIKDPTFIKQRIFTFWAELPERHKCLEESLLNLLNELVPVQIAQNVRNSISQLKKESSEASQLSINFLQDRIKRSEDAWKDYQVLLNNEPIRQQKFTEKRVELNNLISNCRTESRNEINEYLHNKINSDKLTEFIKSNFTNKNDASKELGSIVAQDINYNVKKILEDKSEKLSKGMEEFFNDYNPNKVSGLESNSDIEIPFDSRAAFLGGLTTLASIGAYTFWVSTLGNLGGYILVAKAVGFLSALGISVGGGAAASTAISLIGGPITIAIGLGVLIGYLVFKFFGDSWQRRLAKKFVEKWHEKDYSDQIRSSADNFWDATLNAFHTGMTSIETAWIKNLNMLKEIADPDNREKFENQLRDIEELKSFFDQLPMEGL